MSIAPPASRFSSTILLPIAILAGFYGVRLSKQKSGASPAKIVAKARAEMDSGQDEAALSDTLALIARFPKNHVYPDQPATLFLKLRRDSEAAPMLERFMLVAPDPTERCLPLILIYRRLGQPGPRLDAVQRCLKLEPTNSDLILQLALAQEANFQVNSIHPPRF